ncbi:MAG TPA: exodeoxyribonuclease VII small subunit [Gammaproteobacteria bacterium]|nr:exodeoxyribonuclease VII small subunit [Gammaproteobacteria bacterium]
MAKKPATSVGGLEQSLKELEALVERLESGDLPLEEALKQFEHGVKLTRACQTILKQAEQKVEILLQKTDAAEPVSFEPAEDE